MLKCDHCDGAVVLISGKGSGYYGCYNATRKTCGNRLMVSRKRIEEGILTELKSRILTPENLEYVYKRVEKEAVKALDDSPAQIKQRKAKRDKLEDEIHNYLEFIKIGNLSKAVSEALTDAEKSSEALKQEIASLEFQTNSLFRPPSREWIEARLDRFQEILQKDTVASALALRELLGSIRLQPVIQETVDGTTGLLRPTESGPRNDFKPHYVAHTKIQTPALLDERYQGSNWCQLRCLLDEVRIFFQQNPDALP